MSWFISALRPTTHSYSHVLYNEVNLADFKAVAAFKTVKFYRTETINLPSEGKILKGTHKYLIRIIKHDRSLLCTTLTNHRDEITQNCYLLLNI